MFIPTAGIVVHCSIGVYCPGLPAGRWGEQSLADCEETQVGRNQASISAQLCAQNFILIFNYLMRQAYGKSRTQENLNISLSRKFPAQEIFVTCVNLRFSVFLSGIREGGGLGPRVGYLILAPRECPNS
jgi:hypothetical protein